jgi:hypothetical protein
MVCTVADISLSAGWTPADLMDALEQSHVDAGLATGNCFDRYGVSDNQSLVHRVQTSADAFGSDYVKWTFYDGSLYYSRQSGWNATTHVPVGDFGLDWWNDESDNYNSMQQVGQLQTGTSVIVRRYTSGLDSKFTAFVLKQGAKQLCWFYSSTNATEQSWIDFSKRSMNTLFFPGFTTNGYFSFAYFVHNYALRRDLHASQALSGINNYYYKGFFMSYFRYAAFGTSPSGTTTNWPYDTQTNFADAPSNNIQAYTHITLPTDTPENNPAYTARFAPIFAGLAYNPYILDGMPDDFGLAPMSTNALTNGDRLIVSPTEQWEVVTDRNHYQGEPCVSFAFSARVT